MKTAIPWISAGFLRPQQHFLFQRSASLETLAIGAEEILSQKDTKGGFNALRSFLQRTNERAFGHISYEMKDDVEKLSSSNLDRMNFPAISLFIPETILQRNGNEQWRTLKGENCIPKSPDQKNRPGTIELLPSFDKDSYTKNFERIQTHIQRGDVYELNYCVEFSASQELDPFQLFQELDTLINAPHAAFYRNGSKFAICMSPERFLLVEDDEVITRPMKGTRPRSLDPAKDESLKNELMNDVKERAENIMAVDVARNDLSRIAAEHSVVVDELCTVRSYPNVHQMVSSVRCRLKEGKDNVDLLKASFPMASMTGAPKIRAMQIIEELEAMKRGLYSGCIGSLDLKGHLDLNVVIRTIEYDAYTHRSSYKSGGAITALSKAEAEYDEVLFKAASVLSSLKDENQGQ